MTLIRKICAKYREVIVYIIVGLLTTMVSWAVCFICKLFLDPEIVWQNYLINTIGWAAGVCFAYPLNRKWVFKSDNPGILKEFLEFASSRLFTYILEIIIMLLAVNALKIDYWISKICIAAVLVTVINYLVSKKIIFRER